MSQSQQPQHQPQSQPHSHYLKPNSLATRLNRTIGWLARRGISLAGSADLAVRGRKSGEWRRVPVNPMAYGDGRYLVSARGNSEWVRNMRAAGGGELRVGRRTRPFTAVEVPPAEAPALLRAYLKRWGWEVKAYFGEITADSSDEELLAAAPRHPVFRITET
ncbi:nitroreductase family deazaflavin-dependent oxidoreductase [Streptomyces piniterrae]|uniref:Nitroreductase family deazaflavin-dependent oxidoreductase n=1 Tax=Streptomyces piniterrae TaxID=2571125 RepID=A0A4V5MI55_9ACTN|nr:nitroreductase family deazaflavin-dependent oxidoreductase [Streptomyces piniterrae]TJZ44088.1 nitroreductase family deazaflavin-dependent oxidoreductase [Streptomyces piniterrae]